MKILLEVLRNVFAKPFTKKYPAERAEVQPKFRGIVIFAPKKCNGCRLCSANCPAVAIKFIKKGKISFDLGKCIFCGYCAEICRARAITFDTRFELSAADKKELIIR